MPKLCSEVIPPSLMATFKVLLVWPNKVAKVFPIHLLVTKLAAPLRSIAFILSAPILSKLLLKTEPMRSVAESWLLPLVCISSLREVSIEFKF